jgi:hypothetical protein
MIERPTQIVIHGDIIYWVVACALLTPLVTALVHDAQSRHWIWLFFNILLPPIGIVRGLCIWLRWI